MSDTPKVLDYQSPQPRGPFLRDDIAYILPMFTFLGFVWLGTNWYKEQHWTWPAAYLARTLIVAALLIYLWPRFTKVRWNYWWLGILVGVIGIFQWIGMQLWRPNQL